MVYQGETIFKASDYVRTNRKTGERWVKNYNENGLEGLYSIFEHANDLRWKMKADYQITEGKVYYKKRANLNEAHFGLLRNARNFQKLNRNGIKNAEKELTLRSIAHNIQKIHEKLNATLI